MLAAAMWRNVAWLAAFSTVSSVWPRALDVAPARREKPKEIQVLNAEREFAVGPAAWALGTQSYRDPHRRARSHAGDVSRCAQSNHCRHRAPKHWARFSRL